MVILDKVWNFNAVLRYCSPDLLYFSASTGTSLVSHTSHFCNLLHTCVIQRARQAPLQARGFAAGAALYDGGDPSYVVQCGDNSRDL